MIDSGASRSLVLAATGVLSVVAGLLLAYAESAARGGGSGVRTGGGVEGRRDARRAPGPAGRRASGVAAPGASGAGRAPLREP